MGNAKPCKYCENLVAPDAEQCPQCGGKGPYPYPPSAVGGCLVTILLVAIAAIAIVHCSSSETSKPSSVTGNSPETHDGQKESPKDCTDEFAGMDRPVLEKKVEVLRDAVRIARVKVSVEQDKVREVQVREGRPAYQSWTLVELQSASREVEMRLAAAEKRLESMTTTRPHANLPDYDPDKAKRGKEILGRVFAKHSTLDPFYEKADRGSSSISVPEDEWLKLSEEERVALGHYMESESPGYWMIHVGRISPDGKDVYLDRTVLRRHEWQQQRLDSMPAKQ